MFQNYTSGGKSVFKGDKTEKKGYTTQLTKKAKQYQMGRLEARKYLTLDWEMPLDYADPETNFLLSDMFYSEQERFYGRRTIDTRLLYFDYYWIDYKEAARRGKIITKSVDSRRSYSYDSLQNVSSANADGNLYSRSRRDPLSKDYKRDDLHRSALYTMDANNNKVWVDTTVYTDQAFADGKQIADAMTSANPMGGEDVPQPGEGPSQESREQGNYDVQFFADVDEGCIEARVTGDMDPGYGSTSKMITESAMCLIYDCNDLSGGIYTPAPAMGNKLIKRLIKKAGLTFDII